MIKHLVNKSLSLKLLLGLALLMGLIKVSICAETKHFPDSPRHQYASFSEFSTSVCLPCHYQNIPNGTDLYTLFANATEIEIKRFLLPILSDGNMPPNKVYRQILYNKFLKIE